MKWALNRDVFDLAGVGHVAVLPEACDCDNGVIHTYRSTGPWVDVRCPDCARPGDVLGVVTKCERCKGTGRYGIVGPPCGHCHDDVDARLFGGGVKSGMGYAPLKFVKVLDVWQIVGNGDDLVKHYQSGCILVTKHRDTGERLVVFVRLGAEPGAVVLDLPDAEPGGVALHVEWTDCPTCDGTSVHPDDLVEGDAILMRPCPTCQTPFIPPGDAPIVEVK